MDQDQQLFTEIFHCLLLDGNVPEERIEDEVHAIMDDPAHPDRDWETD